MPSPGPMAITSAHSRLPVIPSAYVPVIASGRQVFIISVFCGAVAIFTMPHPVLAAAFAASIHAPLIPAEPAIISTLPKLPLLERIRLSGIRRGKSSFLYV